ncbi:DUF6228 family protein [Lentzea sp. NPDC051213]|uniref:DUF6228 family protein n=1 Tax=Lentzea sp. NPDC051213 TaxID=3364126 RepID=UPI0037987284
MVITCVKHPETKVLLDDCASIDADITMIGASLRTPGMEASLGIEVIDHDGLARFFEELADDYAGWQGERVWRAFQDELVVTAAFHSRGHVELRWRLELEAPAWSATVTTWVHAGEDMRRLAADLHAMFAAR